APARLYPLSLHDALPISFDAKGNRRDEVEFHPAYHELMAHSAHAGVHNSTWTAQGRPAGGAAEVVRAAKFYIASQVETGHLCPRSEEHTSELQSRENLVC